MFSGGWHGNSSKRLHSTHNLRPLVQNILFRNFPRLRTLDLDFD